MFSIDRKKNWLNRRVKKRGRGGERRKKKDDIEHPHGLPLSCKRIKVFCRWNSVAHVDRMNEIEREKERKKRQTRSSLLDVLHKINPSFHYSRRFVTRDHYSPFNETRAHSTRFTVIHPFFHDSILYRALFRVYFPPNHLPLSGFTFERKW